VRLVSIVMPAFNATATIGAALAALEAQDPAIKREIIVVDDGSTDGTATVASSFRGVRVVRQTNSGPAVARNHGASLARGELVLFIDSDCEAAPDWLPSMLAPFSDPTVVAVKGAYRTRQRPLAARFVQLEYEDKYDRLARHPSIDFVDTYSAAFRREVFASSGGYSSEFTTASAEDVELSFRMHRAGHKMVFRPDAIVYHRHPEGFRAYLAKKFKFSSWRVLAVRRNPEKILTDSHTPQLMKIQAVTAPVIAALAVTAAIIPAARLAAAIALIAYAASTLPFTFKAARKDPVVATISPLVLFLRGLSQGAGLVAGIVRLARVKAPNTALAPAPSSVDRPAV